MFGGVGEKISMAEKKYIAANHFIRSRAIEFDRLDVIIRLRACECVLNGRYYNQMHVGDRPRALSITQL